jgi:hypothetical protein
MQLVVFFLIDSELMTMITLIVITLMMVMTLQFIKSLKWINTLLLEKKSQQSLEKMVEIQKIVTSASWLDQCLDRPLSIDFAEIVLKALPPSQYEAAVQEKC